MRTIRPLPPVCRALLAVAHDWPAMRKVIGGYAEFEAEPPMPGLGLPERQRSVLWAYMRECEDYDATTNKALRVFARNHQPSPLEKLMAKKPKPKPKPKPGC